MFSIKNWIYLVVIVSALAVFIPRSAAQTISCSSDDGKRHYCAASESGRARLVNQRSESACTEGYSWGSDDRGLWVDHGCRADFAIEERRGGDRDHDRDGDRGPSSDAGQYVILSAQYGTSRRHVDVTNRLKELARQDRVFRMGNSTFGLDPDQGQEKTLRIYARGPNGQDRMFEYREGSTVDGSQFRSWGGGDWGNGGWNGRWEGSGYEAQPEMTAAIQHLREAQRNLELASRDKGGHRALALQHVNQAIAEVEAGIQYDNTH
jgi:hypothetical protein